MTFDAPWQARAHALALGVVDRAGLSWDDFRERLMGAIDEDPERPYYESWVAALEALLVDHGLVQEQELVVH